MLLILIYMATLGGRQSTRQGTARLAETRTIIAKDQIRTIRVPQAQEAQPLHLPYHEFARLRTNAAVRTQSAIQHEHDEQKRVSSSHAM